MPALVCGPYRVNSIRNPFIRLADGLSLLQKSFLRAVGLPGVAEVLTVTNRDLFKTADEYRETGEIAVPLGFILEPQGRNTAPAIAAAALTISKAYGPDAVLLFPDCQIISSLTCPRSKRRSATAW